MWDEITYPFPNFNGCTVGVWEWISNFTPSHYWVCDYLSMLGLKLKHLSKKGPWPQDRCYCINSQPSAVAVPIMCEAISNHYADPTTAMKHDDVIKWEHFPRYRSSVNSPDKGQWRGALMLSLIYAWTNAWVNNRNAGDLRRHRAHYDGTVMCHVEYIT